MNDSKELKEIQEDSKKRGALKDFMLETLEEMAVQKVKAGEPVDGVREAFQLVDRLFEKLDKINEK